MSDPGAVEPFPDWVGDAEALPPPPFRASMAAVSPEGIIGVDQTIPWHYPADVKRLWRLTRGATVVFGRLTWETLPRRPLRRRRNLVVSRSPVESAETFRSVAEAVTAAVGETVWFLGGTGIYEEAMDHADFLDITLIPDRIRPAPGQRAVFFPRIDPARWIAGPLLPDPADPGVARRRYLRRKDFA